MIRVAYIVAVLLLCAALFVSCAHAALLGAAVSVAAYIVMSRRWIVLLVLMAVVSFWFLPSTISPSKNEGNISSINPFKEGNLHEREKNIWPQFIRQASVHPWRGVGIGNAYQTTNGATYGPHSFAITMHSYAGVVGIILFFVPYVFAMYRRAGDVACKAALIGVVTVMPFDELSITAPITMLLYGMVLAMGVTGINTRNFRQNAS